MRTRAWFTAGCFLMLTSCGAPSQPVSSETDTRSPSASQSKDQRFKPTPLPETPTSEPQKAFRVLEHVGYSFDDALEVCIGFDGDGRTKDPLGISGKAALIRAHESIETKVMPDGREALCMLGPYLGSPGCTFKEGRWLHRLAKADGTIVKLPNDVRSYRLHHGEIDAWLWQSNDHSFPYDFIGTTFEESCPAESAHQ